MLDGYHKTYRFDNGYGASVVSTPFTYGGKSGLFEVAILKDGGICYDTPIADDVVGWLDFAEVAEMLEKIKKLP